MAGNNTGIMQNSGALSTNAIKDVENSVLESNGAVAYIDENNELCIAMSQGVSLLKDLAWDNAYELTEENNVYVKKAYKKNSLNSFYLKDTFTKATLSGVWAVAGGDNEPTEPGESLEGSGSEYYAAAPSMLSFRSTAPLDEFQEVQVNGETVEPQNYTLEEGSTIVKFTVDYLKTLGEGTHEVSIVSKNQIAKGDFKVKSPELNQYGFYYNQPYYGGYVELGEPFREVFTGEIAFMLTSEETGLMVNFDAEGWIDVSVTKENDEYTINYAGCKFSGKFSDDGKTFIGTHAEGEGSGGWIPDYSGPGVDFTLDSEVICADEEYIYMIDFGREYYKVDSKQSNKMELGPIKSNINGLPVAQLCNSAFNGSAINKLPDIPTTITELGHYAFHSCDNLVEVIVPDHITSITSSTFAECNNLSTFVMPATVTYLGDYIFSGSHNLKAIQFKGTRAQWNAIEKSERWSNGWAVKSIICTDGTITT